MGLGLGLLLCPLNLFAATEFCMIHGNEVSALLARNISSLTLSKPVAVADIRCHSSLQPVAADLHGFLVNALYRHRIPTVEIDDTVLDEVLERIDDQASMMVNQNTSVELGKWTAAGYLLVGAIELPSGKNKAQYHYRLIDLETRVQIMVDSLAITIQDCGLQSTLLELPGPSPGGKSALPGPERRR